MAGDPERFGAPRGTYDLLPSEASSMRALFALAGDVFEAAGYRPIETPAFEHTEVFERGVGEASEVVTKQMYTFGDRAGRSLTLRPEGTAPVVRAILEHGLNRRSLPVKLYYTGAYFRQERPQKGRYRQFWQVGIEAVGSEEPAVDAEVIELGNRFIRAAGVEPHLLLNSIGHPGESCRTGYIRLLTEFLQRNVDRLHPEDRDRIKTNPLRTFDSKQRETVGAMGEAPLISDHLCADCSAHFESVKRLLDSIDIEYSLEPRLVRGLDYYTRTAFEFTAGGLGAQNAVGGGGRYDGLSELLGGPRLPGIGFGLGADRILMAAGGQPVRESGVTAYVVALGEDARAEAFRLVARLRATGIGAETDLGGRGMKGQMKDASRSGARWAVILGADELAAGTATIKDLASGEQTTVPAVEVERRVAG